MEWEKLLSTQRQGHKNKKAPQFDRFDVNDFDDDFLAIVSSQAFRRLQDKTQVFPLDKSDFVRTRLTHSMEVSTIARQMGVMIAQDHSRYLKEDFKAHPEQAAKIPTVVSCAGLLHDIGNPPFGHYGESVLGNWFRKKFRDDSFTFRGVKVGDLLNEQMKADLENFEGNAQGLRILAKSRNKENGCDVNLTYAVMNTLIKYPTSSTHFDKKHPDVKYHKLGYYYAEKEIMEEVCKATGTLTENGYVRHPLVFIMEAADDIAYATADLEDAFKKESFTLDQFIAFFDKQVHELFSRKLNEFISSYEDEALRQKMLDYVAIRDRMKAESAKRTPESQAKVQELDQERKALFSGEEQEALQALVRTIDNLKKPEARLKVLKKQLAQQETRSTETDFNVFSNWLEETRMWLMYSACYAFSLHYNEIMAGTFTSDLFEGTYSDDLLHIMKSVMREFVYDTHDMVLMQLSAKRIVESLLEDFISAAMYYDEPDGDQNITPIDDRFLRVIPDNFKEDYKAAKRNLPADLENMEGEKLYLRFLMVTDFISGMTDSYAKNLYQISNGFD